MRFSQLVIKTTAKAVKGKNVDQEITQIVETVKSVVNGYRGDSKANKQLRKNKDVEVDTIRGCVPLSFLDNASLLAIIQREHSKVIQETCANRGDENFSLNAELKRGLATNAKILGATYWLEKGETEELYLL